MTKKCTRCGLEKDLTEFYLKIKGVEREIKNTFTRCKPCSYITVRKWAKKNKDKIRVYHQTWDRKNQKRQIESRLIWKYSLSMEEFQKLSESQGNKCLICKVSAEHLSLKKLYVDHDHKTGEIRGLLCRSCNIGIGMMKDNPEILRNAINYLETQNRKAIQKFSMSERLATSV